MTPDHQRYRALGIPTWPDETGSDAGLVFRHEVKAEYDPGIFEQVRFGAVVGWQANARWWLDTAGRLPPGTLRQLGLLDIEHQAGGHSCLPWFCVGLPARLRAEAVPFAAGLCRDHYAVRSGHIGQSSDPDDAQRLAAFKARVRQAGLTVDDQLARRNFMEAVYPLDASAGNFAALLAEPDQVRASLQKILGAAPAGTAPAIFLLAGNSD